MISAKGGTMAYNNSFEDIAIPGVDTEKACQIYHGDREFFICVLRIFANGAKDLTDALRKVSNDNLSDYAINIHGLKGACANICADALALRARELEADAKSGDLRRVLALNGALLDDVESLIHNICNIREVRDEVQDSHL